MADMTELTDREIADLKETLRRIESKLDNLIPQASAHEERLKAVERSTEWQWYVLGAVALAVLTQVLHLIH